MKELHADILAAEIGSTTTVVNAFDGVNTPAPRLLGQGFAGTTAAEGDVVPGLKAAVAHLEEKLGGKLTYGKMIAASSAAGGLRMTVHGLVPDMTARAAKEAALGAGAVLKLITCGKMTEGQLAQVSGISPNIILLAGGVDYGESETALYNAARLRDMSPGVPVVYAGNVACREEIQGIFKDSGHKLYIVDNVYPRIDELNVEGAQQAVQRVFEEHITQAPGMARVRGMVDGGIMPTPGAVMAMARELYNRMGDLMVIDVGGATTDIHSVTEGSPEIARISLAPEPLAKRTVEGDLGVFINADNIAEAVGREVVARDLGRELTYIPNGIPRTTEETRQITYLTSKAAETAIIRHVGRKRSVFGPTGRVATAAGKDLTQVRFVIGTGGALTRLPGRRDILRNALSVKDPAKTMLLPGPEVSFLTDDDYIMAALGVLSRYDKDAAVTLLKRSLRLPPGA